MAINWTEAQIEEVINAVITSLNGGAPAAKTGYDGSQYNGRRYIGVYTDMNEAIEAADGMEAVKLCRENDYDLILMDVMMPHLDGFSAVKEIKKNKDIPVIMLSARGEEYDKLFAFEIGVDDYVTKPFSSAEFLARDARGTSGKD